MANQVKSTADKLKKEKSDEEAILHSRALLARMGVHALNQKDLEFELKRIEMARRQCETFYKNERFKVITRFTRRLSNKKSLTSVKANKQADTANKPLTANREPNESNESRSEDSNDDSDDDLFVNEIESPSKFMSPAKEDPFQMNSYFLLSDDPASKRNVRWNELNEEGESSSLKQHLVDRDTDLVLPELLIDSKTRSELMLRNKNYKHVHEQKKHTEMSIKKFLSSLDKEDSGFYACKNSRGQLLYSGYDNFFTLSKTASNRPLKHYDPYVDIPAKFETPKYLERHKNPFILAEQEARALDKIQTTKKGATMTTTTTTDTTLLISKRIAEIEERKYQEEMTRRKREQQLKLPKIETTDAATKQPSRASKDPLLKNHHKHHHHKHPHKHHHHHHKLHHHHRHHHRNRSREANNSDDDDWKRAALEDEENNERLNIFKYEIEDDNKVKKTSEAKHFLDKVVKKTATTTTTTTMMNASSKRADDDEDAKTCFDIFKAQQTARSLTFKQLITY